jgi:hypothetical protein
LRLLGGPVKVLKSVAHTSKDYYPSKRLPGPPYALRPFVGPDNLAAPANLIMSPESSERGTGPGLRRGRGPPLLRMGHRQRSMMWTGIFAFITILGTWYGAQLKTDWDAVKASRIPALQSRLGRVG